MEERNKVDANDYVNQAIQMLKDLPEIKDSPFTAGYNGVVSLLEYAKESHTASLTKQREGWVRGGIPKDGTVIQRWHKLWDCPVSVIYFPNKFAHEWVEGTLSNSWPEESFTEDWMPLPTKPSSNPPLIES